MESELRKINGMLKQIEPQKQGELVKQIFPSFNIGFNQSKYKKIQFK